MAFSTPVLLLVFNRPTHTQRVFEQIRRIQPSLLFVSADGPRSHISGEAEKCQQVRAILDQIDWDCTVKMLFRDQNLGCRRAVREGISWFFQHVDSGIILEDDCVPDQTFFSFCAGMLEQYRFDDEIMHISGSNPVPSASRRLSSDYFFSRMPLVWGWATWRRAWQHYDDQYQELNALWLDAAGPMAGYLSDRTASRYVFDKFQRTRDGEIDTWDYAWFYAILFRRGVCITPSRNLVQNIGFDASATHTKAGLFSRKQPEHRQMSESPLGPESRQPVEAMEHKIFQAAQKGNLGLLARRLAPAFFFKPLPSAPTTRLPMLDRTFAWGQTLILSMK